MATNKDIIKIYSGTELTVILLKGNSEEAGIPSMIKNDFQSGNSAGFFGGIPSAVDLFIQASDIERAQPVINDFLQFQNKELN